MILLGITIQEVSRRRLRSTLLDFLSALKDEESVQRAKAHFDASNCMTDRVAALGALASMAGPDRESALAAFHSEARGDALVLNKWFGIQGLADLPDVLEKVKQLRAHPDFVISNPNRARALIGAFAGNMAHFHAKNGEGYQFVADAVMELDGLNPMVASRLCNVFAPWRRYDEERQGLMRGELERIKTKSGLSKETYEVVLRCLK